LRDLAFGDRPFRTPHRLFHDPDAAEREAALVLPEL
jgi:hypothetical protein